MKISIVTGASSGLGREFARKIAEEAIDELWVVARRADRLEALKEELEKSYPGLGVRPVTADLTAQAGIDKLADMLAAEKPRVEILVNASGFGKYGTYKDLTTEEITQMIDLNCKSVVLLTYAVLPYMDQGS